MSALMEHPSRVVAVATTVIAALCLLLVVTGSTDAFGLVTLLTRSVHVLAAMLWGGLIVFMNFLHIRAIEGASDAERAGFVRWYVDGLGRSFSLSARVVIASGIVLLATSGYVLSSVIFGSAVFMPGARAAVLWTGVIGGLVMAALVEAGVRPAFRAILDPATPPPVKAAARAKAKTIARINLFLLLPVTFLMVVAAHG